MQCDYTEEADCSSSPFAACSPLIFLLVCVGCYGVRMCHVARVVRGRVCKVSFLLPPSCGQTLGLHRECRLAGLWFLIKTVAQAGLKLPVLLPQPT